LKVRNVAGAFRHCASVFRETAPASCCTYWRSARYSHSVAAEAAPDPPPNPADCNSQRFIWYSGQASVIQPVQLLRFRSCFRGCSSGILIHRDAAKCVCTLMQAVTAWLAAHQVPQETPEDGLRHWIVTTAGRDLVPVPSAPCIELLCALDDLVERCQSLGRFLSQIAPLGKDRGIAESPGVRIMTMIGSKGLRACATILAGLEGRIVRRPVADPAEERRLLSVSGKIQARLLLPSSPQRSREIRERKEALADAGRAVSQSAGCGKTLPRSECPPCRPRSSCITRDRLI
jgi:hypothetical protein